MTAWSHPVPRYSLVLAGLCRFRVEEVMRDVPFPVARVSQLDYRHEGGEGVSVEAQPLADEYRASALELVDLLNLEPSSHTKLKRLLSSLPDHTLPDTLTSVLRTSFTEQLSVLTAVDLPLRYQAAQPLLNRQIAALKLMKQGPREDKSNDGGSPRQHRRGRVLQIELPRGRRGGREGEEEEEEDEMKELQKRIEKAKLPEHALKAALKELKRLKSLPVQFPEHSVARNYLETLLDLPWSSSTTDTLDLQAARLTLEADHYGLQPVKKRVLEYLAVCQLTQGLKGPILCLVGAPGVGKTSIGRSVAKTLCRKFHRISLGGVCDQSDIRGHRRTYIGSLPGRIMAGLRTVGVRNPVFLLDEVDKLTRGGVHGDPAAALLEVLDPEQNSSFVDHYVGLPFDLSKILFIATANSVATIPAALLDRMEVLEVQGYTSEEKVEIAVRHLLPKQLKQHGLTPDQLTIPPSTLATIANNYTREAGVRGLERNIGAICRSVAVKVAENRGESGKTTPTVVTETMLGDILGPQKFEHEVSERLTRPGVAVGLAWTGMGGEILFIEASRMPGSGELTLTGQLGDVMKESAQIAFNWLRSNASRYGVQCDVPKETDLHIHFPAGAIGKDGPSAGVAIAVALVSLYSRRCVRSDTAMTGEITLRGLVLPV
ncbi:Lon protease homolog 2, peroxisomal [Geodia barretti]|nr:Lon protease homolog 2, peroxisomal [Geodia barretti]